jgi:hypothetical protein
MLSFQNKKVLVVDDSETMRMFIFFQLIKTLPGCSSWTPGMGWMQSRS